MTSECMRITAPAALLPGAVASVLCIAHARSRLPMSAYSVCLQAAFALSLATALAGAVYYFVHYTDTHHPTTTHLIFIYNTLFFLQAAMYCLAQTFFLRSFIPLNQRLTQTVVCTTRVFVVVATAVAMVVYIAYAYAETDDTDMVLETISFSSISAVLLLDLMVNTYMAVAAHARFIDVARRLHVLLFVAWVVSVVDFGVAVVITFGPGHRSDVWNAVGDMFANVYPQLSYLCIVMIRSMFVAYTSVSPDVDSHITDTTTIGSTSPVDHVALKTSVNAKHIQVL